MTSNDFLCLCFVCLFFLTLALTRWGRWREIMAHGQFRKGWRESDVEDCARVMVNEHSLFMLLVSVERLPNFHENKTSQHTWIT